MCDAFVTTERGLFYIAGETGQDRLVQEMRGDNPSSDEGEEQRQENTADTFDCYAVRTAPFSTSSEPMGLPLPWDKVGVWR